MRYLKRAEHSALYAAGPARRAVSRGRHPHIRRPDSIAEQRETSRRRCSADQGYAPGEEKHTGTGCFLLMNTEKSRFLLTHGLVTDCMLGYRGQVHMRSRDPFRRRRAAIQWLRDEMKLIESRRIPVHMARR